MMNHYTTFFHPSTANIPAGHTAPTPGSPLGLTPYALPPRSLEDQQFNRWTNSQASIIDHPKLQEITARPAGSKGRTLSFSIPFQPSSPMPTVEPDSANTTFSSDGPGTPTPSPAFRDINHYNGNPFALSDDTTLALPRLVHPDKALDVIHDKASGLDLLTSTTYIVNDSSFALPPSPPSTSTLHVEVEGLTSPPSTSAKRKAKRQRRTHTPAPSSPLPTKPVKRAKKASAPEQPHDIFAVDPTEIVDPSGIAAEEMDRTWAGEGEHRTRYGFTMPDTPEPIPLSAATANIGSTNKERRGQRDALEVLASAAAKRRQTESPVQALQGRKENKSDGKEDNVNTEEAEGGLDMDTKAWLLEQYVYLHLLSYHLYPAETVTGWITPLSGTPWTSRSPQNRPRRLLSLPPSPPLLSRKRNNLPSHPALYPVASSLVPPRAPHRTRLLRVRLLLLSIAGPKGGTRGSIGGSGG